MPKPVSSWAMWWAAMSITLLGAHGEVMDAGGVAERPEGRGFQTDPSHVHLALTLTLSLQWG